MGGWLGSVPKWSQLGLECPRWRLSGADSLSLWLLHMASLGLRSTGLQVIGFLTFQLASPRAQSGSCRASKHVGSESSKGHSTVLYSSKLSPPHAKGMDSTSCWGSGKVTWPTSMWDGRHCPDHLWTVQSATSSLYGRKVGVNAPEVILKQRGRELVDTGRSPVFQRDSSEVYGTDFSGDPSRTEPRFPTGELAQMMPSLLPFTLSPSSSPLPFYFLGPSPSSALRPCSPGKPNQDTQFPHLKKSPLNRAVNIAPGFQAVE